MMADTFTRDKDGKRYKVVGGTKYNPPGVDYEVIKPVEEIKEDWLLEFGNPAKYGGNIFLQEYGFTDKQARAVADSIEALMVWLLSEIPEDKPDRKWIELLRVGEIANKLLEDKR